MRLRTILNLSAIAALLTIMSAGCSEGTDVKLATAPPVPQGEAKPLPPEKTKGGGPTSSGNVKKPPYKGD